MIRRGSAFLVPSGPQGRHLFVVALGPALLPGHGKLPQVALAGITSLHAGLPHDPACIVEAGEHPFVKHRSFVAYRHMRMDSLEHVESMVGEVWPEQPACNEALRERIARGVFVSRLVPRHIRQAFPA